MHSDEAAALGNTLLAEFVAMVDAFNLMDCAVMISVTEANQLWEEVSGQFDVLIPLLSEPYGGDESVQVVAEDEPRTAASESSELSPVRGVTVARVSGERRLEFGHTAGLPVSAATPAKRRDRLAEVPSDGRPATVTSFVGIQAAAPRSAEFESGADAQRRWYEPSPRVEDLGSTESRVNLTSVDDVGGRVGGFSELAMLLQERPYSEVESTEASLQLELAKTEGEPLSATGVVTQKLQVRPGSAIAFAAEVNDPVTVFKRRTFAGPHGEALRGLPISHDPVNELPGMQPELRTTTTGRLPSGDLRSELNGAQPDMDEIIEALTEMVALDYRRFYGT